MQEVVYGDDELPDSTPRSPTSSASLYDACLRPIELQTTREPTSGMGSL